MTKKDYIAIAKAIVEATYYNYGAERVDRQRLIDELSIYFEEDNEAFDKDKFVRACYSPIVRALCPICGKEYKYRKEYAMKNKTCPTRECKNALHKLS
jgi:hypothetical protein